MSKYGRETVAAKYLADSFGGPSQAEVQEAKPEHELAVDNPTKVERWTEPDPIIAGQVIQNLMKALNAAQLRWEASTLYAAVAGLLSSQFLLLAGPSGTGKSTLARALLKFFVPPDSAAAIDGRRQLLGPEDIAGFRSPIDENFVPGFGYSSLRRLNQEYADAPTPALLIEEVNLSPLEGYLAPIVHGLSGLSATTITWPLFQFISNTELSESVFNIGPWPRLVGTINVDATAMAPSPKVAARACVLLLMPSDGEEAVEKIVKTVCEPPAAGIAFDELAGTIFGDPLIVLRARPQVVEQNRLSEAITSVLNLIGEKPPTRQIAQMAVYTSWFVLLTQNLKNVAIKPVSVDANEPADLYRLGAENALLHHVLPSMRPDEFSKALHNLDEKATFLIPEANDADVLGGLVKPRVRRLLAAEDDSAGRFLDYWDRLS